MSLEQEVQSMINELLINFPFNLICKNGSKIKDEEIKLYENIYNHYITAAILENFEKAKDNFSKGVISRESYKPNTLEIIANNIREGRLNTNQGVFLTEKIEDQARNYLENKGYKKINLENCKDEKFLNIFMDFYKRLSDLQIAKINILLIEADKN